MSARHAARLSSAQQKALRQVVASRRTPPYLARRAAIVLDEHRARWTGEERIAGVSRQTAGKWLRRFVEHGLAGLEDAPRSGRPVGRLDGVGEKVLTAPLFADSAAWTSRSVAAYAECSQSAVARVWKKAYDDDRTELGAAFPPAGLYLVACLAGPDDCLLLFRVQDRASGAPAARTGGFMRSPLRPALQTVLATELLARDAGLGTANFRSGIGAHVASGTPHVAVCTSRQIARELRETAPGIQVVVVERDRWQGLLLTLGPRISPSSRQALTTAQHRAMDWARTTDEAFMWLDQATSREPSGTSPHAPLATTEHVADSIVATLQREILAGRLGGGDRITESYLARSVHASRGHVRDALRVLASRGIIELEPNRGAVVPRPALDDVVETYAARRALGALLVRRAAETQMPDHRLRVEAALRQMLETAKSGDAWATGEDDFRFQEAIAASTGMRRVPAMFSTLTTQLQMFVAVLGLRYAYSIPDMCRDDVELLQLISDHKADEAVSHWNAKMNAAANYMIRHLDPRHS